MEKYSFEFKKKLVLEYLDGKGGTEYLSEKNELGTSKQLRNWTYTYNYVQNV